MPFQEVKYKGKTVSAATYEAGGGRWCWTYQIDDGPICRGAVRALLSQPLMMAEAIETAKRQIDEHMVTRPAAQREQASI